MLDFRLSVTISFFDLGHGHGNMRAKQAHSNHYTIAASPELTINIY